MADDEVRRTGESSSDRADSPNVLPPQPPRLPPQLPHVPPPPRRFSLRDKAPELAVEAASVVFAVLLALGVDGWQERQREQRRAQNARERIVAEIEANRAELFGSLDDNRELFGRIQTTRSILQTEDSGSLQFNFQVPVLSAAAWNTAQMTGATQPLPFDWLIGIAGLYEGQALYVSTSSQVLEQLPGTIAALERGEGAQALSGIVTSLGIVLDIANRLLATYDSLLTADGRPLASPGVDSQRSQR